MINPNGEWIVNVAFADAHVDALNRSYIEEILADELNAGAAKELQIEGF